MQQNLLQQVFSGEYAFTRDIQPDNLRPSGKAIFTKRTAADILYEETGEYIADSKEYTFIQSRIFHITQNKLIIYKNDNSILHQFVLDKENDNSYELTHTHVCGQDNYKIRIKIQSKNKFIIEYNVSGPNKAYVVTTNYNRMKHCKNSY